MNKSVWFIQARVKMTDRLQSLRGEGAKLWKMMADADDIETLEQGMALAEAFEGPSKIY